MIVLNDKINLIVIFFLSKKPSIRFIFPNIFFNAFKHLRFNRRKISSWLMNDHLQR